MHGHLKEAINLCLVLAKLVDPTNNELRGAVIDCLFERGCI